MEMEPSPPPFIVFRSPKALAKVERVDVYQLALDFTAAVETITTTIDARFHLKDRIDRSAFAIAIWVGKAASDLSPTGRRKTYRDAHKAALDCSTVLDILARRRDVDRGRIEPAQKLIAQLLEQLAALSV